MSDAQIESTTIVAIATPPGRGGIGVVRLSGRDVLRICEALLPNAAALEPRRASYRILRDSDGARVDDALLTLFPAPHSYTGEDVLEIATHGSPVVQDWLLRACLEHGAMLARPGEFTERAYLNHRLDLAAAEAVRDLIEAQTLAQAQLAAQQMGGAVAGAVRPMKQQLVQLIATLEAGIDFAEDDLDVVRNDEVLGSIRSIASSVTALAVSFRHGRLLRQGVRLAIVGEPNVGKSSLFNRLLQQERAIVTSTPGTTRDVIGEHVSLDGVPLHLLDTAGLRETEDEAERMGIARSREALADADAVLLVLDGSRAESRVIPQAIAELLHGRPVVPVLNKIDLRSENGGAAPADVALLLSEGSMRAVRTSAITGAGFEDLKQAILQVAGGGEAGGSGAATLTNLRQHAATGRAVDALHRAEAAAGAVPHEMILLDLYEALHALDELTGETTPDDVLHLIFSSFCIGK